MSKKKYTAYLQLHVNKYCICISPCVPGRKISFEKSATGFSVKFGRKTTEVIQEFDALCRTSMWIRKGKSDLNIGPNVII